MPEISRFFGIVISMYFNDHQPPHFHARYGSSVVRVGIETGLLLSGSFPPRALGLVTEWAALHRDELLANWLELREGRAPMRIAPLQ